MNMGQQVLADVQAWRVLAKYVTRQETVISGEIVWLKVV